jgi:hypothetical protein
MINDTAIPRSDSVKYLGLILTDNMDWSSRITKVVQKLNFIIKSISTILPFMSTQGKIQLFHSHILSNMLYGCEIWGHNLTNDSKQKLKKVITFYSRIALLQKDELVALVNTHFKKRFQSSITKILLNPNHVLHKKLAANKNTAYNTRNACLTKYCRTTSYQKSFIPSATLFLTNQYEPLLI